jgi:Tol biopolymer transport system component
MRTTSSATRRGLAVAGIVATELAVAATWATPASAAPSTTRVSVSSAELQANDTSVTPAVSSDGNYIAFTSAATNLAGGVSGSQVYVRDAPRGVTELVSKASNGAVPNDSAIAPSISSDGRVVAFQSRATNLVAGDTNANTDVFVHDRLTGVTTRASVSSSGVQGNGLSAEPAVSGDGRYVTYSSTATNLVAGDTNGVPDVFVFDRVSRTTTRVSVGITGVQGNGPSRNPSISRDGAKVAFESGATNLISGADTNGSSDVYVGSRSRVLFRASQSSTGGQGNASSSNPAISGDGRAIVFESRSTNLVNGDTNSRADVFHHDAITRQTNRVSNGRNSGVTNDPGNGDSIAPSVSFNGRVVAFASTATNLISGDTNGAVQDVFVANLDRPSGAQNTLASVALGGGSGNGVSATPSLSSNGLVVAYHSRATNLLAGDTNNVLDVYARTL